LPLVNFLGHVYKSVPAHGTLAVTGDTAKGIATDSSAFPQGRGDRQLK
jgi:hypothetical protein